MRQQGGWAGGRRGEMSFRKSWHSLRRSRELGGAACDTATVIVLLSGGESLSLRGTLRMTDGREREAVMKPAAAWRANMARWNRCRPKRRDPSSEDEIQKIKRKPLSASLYVFQQADPIFIFRPCPAREKGVRGGGRGGASFCCSQ